MNDERFEIYLSATPGLEQALREEALGKGFAAPKLVTGGVAFKGRWQEVWRANLELRGAGAVLVRIGSFPAAHLSELDKRLRAFPFAKFLRRDVPLRVEASCSASEVYHTGAVEERLQGALAGFTLNDDAPLALMARIHKNVCTLSIDTSGEALHKRGHKQAIAKAPLRETMAALFLQQCGFKGAEPVLDPMCGSGTFVIEAAEIAMNLMPGRARAFAFENLPSFDPAAWKALREKQKPRSTPLTFMGFDRDAGAITAATANAGRASVGQAVQFKQQSLSALRRPYGPAGLVITNPPYGGRIGDKQALLALYATFGRVMREHFAGWRVGLVTDSDALAKATGLALEAGAPILHGGLRVKLWQATLPAS